MFRIVVLLPVYPFLGILSLFGFWWTCAALKAIAKARSVTNWPTSNATIKKVELVDDDHETQKEFEVLVDYEYDVNDERFKGNQIHSDYYKSEGEEHHQLYIELKKAGVVKAYFNPKDPDEAYIVAGTCSGQWVSLFLGFAFFASFTFLLLGFHFGIFGNSDYAQGLKVISKAVVP